MGTERGNSFLRRLDWYAGIPLAAMTALARCVERSRQSSPDEAKRVGIICLGAIGDLLLLSGLLRGLRRQLLKASLELIVTHGNAQAAPLLGEADAVAVFNVRQVWPILRHVRSRRYDLLIDSSQWARLGAIVSNLSGARHTVGFSTPGQWRGLGYDVAVPHSGRQHEVENFLALGRAFWPGLSGKPRLRLPEAQPALATEMADGRRHAFFHMWSAGYQQHFKEWRADYWARLTRELTGRGFSVWLTGSATDAKRNADFLAVQLPGERHVYSLAGRASLSELAWLLARADAVVSVNTGIMHLAALAGAPTVGLHAAVDPIRWGPVGPRCLGLLPSQGQCSYISLGFESPPDAKALITHLSVEEVLAGLKSLGVL